MPDIIWLRFSGETMSAIHLAFSPKFGHKTQSELISRNAFKKVFEHILAYCLDNGNHNGIAELFVCLGIRNRYDKIASDGRIETHQTSTFSGCQSSGIFAWLPDKNF